MLYLLFRVGDDRYALDAGQVVAVLPLSDLRSLAHAPREVAGLLNDGGTPVPVIDVCEVMLGRPARRLLSTRQVVVHYRDGAGVPRRLGLVVEGATETLRCDPSAFVDTGVGNRDAPYLGGTAADDRGLIQLIDASAFLPPPLRALLFDPAAELTA